MKAPAEADLQRRCDEMLAAIRTGGMRLTPQRSAVVRTLAFSTEHPSAERIYAAVKADFPMTSLATVYKTVALLKQLGQVTELCLGDGTKRYDAARPFPHPHLICTRCGRVVDCHPASLQRLAGELARETGFCIESHRLDFFGCCPACRGGQKSPRGPAARPVGKRVS